METRDEVVELLAAMCRTLRRWRAEHPEATCDEIAAQVAPLRRRLMGRLLTALALQPGNAYALEGYTCPGCGTAMVYKGCPTRQVDHLEGTGNCPAPPTTARAAARAFPPPRRAAGAPPLDAGDAERGAAPGGGRALGAPGGGAR